MYAKDPIQTDLMVIGTGMAGMAAALFAANRGIQTVQAGVTGELLYATGFLDLMGVYPLESRQVWTDPWAAIRTLIQKEPRHPYARIPEPVLRAAWDEFLNFFENTHMPYRREVEANSRMCTPVGTLKPTYAVPASMWAGVQAIKSKTPCLIVDFQGLKGFSARQIAITLQDVWPGLRSERIAFPGIGQVHDLYPEHMARSLELPQTREALAALIRPLLGDAGVVGMPAMAGMSETNKVISGLAGDLGVPVFEIPTMPPAVPGLRIKELFERELSPKGVRMLLQQRVRLVRHETDGTFSLGVGETGTEYSVHAKSVLLATGRFLGQGLHAGRGLIRETLFDLPVFQPGNREQWHREDLFDPRGHNVNRSGLEIDDFFRPLDDSGQVAYENLFAAGSILAHQDWIRMKCGAGLAIASAYAAIKACLHKLS